MMHENKSFHKLNIFFSKATDDGDMMSPAAGKRKFFKHSSPGNQNNEKAIKRSAEVMWTSVVI